MKLGRVKDDISERVLLINRVSKTVTGGRTMSFAAFTAVGDSNGSVGLGLGKARNVADAIRKGVAQAKREVKRYTKKDATIPHEVIGKFGATQVLLKPAAEGSGLGAGSVVRDILTLAGISDISSKIIGSKNKINVARATMDGLEQLKDYKEVMALRGKKL